MKRAISFLMENSLFLLGGAVLALWWANTDPESYRELLHFKLFENPWVGEIHHGKRVVSVHYFVNDILMAIFFAIAGKEVRESFLPGGPLNKPREAATPLIATLGGVVVPALLFLVGVLIVGREELYSGWAIPCATDIAFSYLVARVIFGTKHPAIPFLLLLAIADDALGLLILAVAYPQQELQLWWMILPLVAMATGWGMARLRLRSFWWYLLICGPISWIGFALAGIHPALGLLPVVAVMPHAHLDTGLFDWRALGQTDTLTQFEHWWKNPTELILGLFALANAGVIFSAIGHATWLVMGGLILGKPLGIAGFGFLAQRLGGFQLPKGMSNRDLVIVGLIAAIGFTVALFVSTVAFPAGPVQDAAKMGALASFAVVPVALIAAKLLRIRKV